MKPLWLVTYEAKDISDEIASMVTGVEYVDAVSGKSDELQLTVSDRDGRWREGWWPSAGDTITARLGYHGAPLLNAGTFKVDEVSLRGKPDTVSIGALAVPKTSALRTVQSRAFEKVTLRELVERVAAELELQVCGEIAPLGLVRVTQSSETNLAFLRRLAETYGYAFSIRLPYLVFYPLVALEDSDPVAAIRRTDLKGYDLSGSTQETYVACEVSYFDAQTKTLRTARVEAAHARKATIINLADPAAANVIIPTRTLRLGVQGEDVASWQTWVISQGKDVGEPDGKFGGKTRRGTIGEQGVLGTNPDGVVGPETIRLAREAGYGSAAASSGSGVRIESSGRVLRKDARVESVEQAEAVARAALLAANRLRVTGTLEVEGDPSLVSGTTIDLQGMGRVSGKYLVQTARHKESRSGYETSVEVTCV